MYKIAFIEEHPTENRNVMKYKFFFFDN